MASAAGLRSSRSSTSGTTTLVRFSLGVAMHSSAPAACARVRGCSAPQRSVSGRMASSRERASWFSCEPRARVSSAAAAHSIVSSVPSSSSSMRRTRGGMPPSRAIASLLSSSEARWYSACTALSTTRGACREYEADSRSARMRETSGAIPPSSAISMRVEMLSSASAAIAAAAHRRVSTAWSTACKSGAAPRALRRPPPPPRAVSAPTSRRSMASRGAIAPSSAMVACVSLLRRAICERARAASSGGPVERADVTTVDRADVEGDSTDFVALGGGRGAMGGAVGSEVGSPTTKREDGGEDATTASPCLPSPALAAVAPPTSADATGRG